MHEPPAGSPPSPGGGVVPAHGEQTYLPSAPQSHIWQAPPAVALPPRPPPTTHVPPGTHMSPVAVGPPSGATWPGHVPPHWKIPAAPQEQHVLPPLTSTPPHIWPGEQAAPAAQFADPFG